MAEKTDIRLSGNPAAYAVPVRQAEAFAFYVGDRAVDGDIFVGSDGPAVELDIFPGFRPAEAEIFLSETKPFAIRLNGRVTRGDICVSPAPAQKSFAVFFGNPPTRNDILVPEAGARAVLLDGGFVCVELPIYDLPFYEILVVQTRLIPDSAVRVSMLQTLAATAGLAVSAQLGGLPEIMSAQGSSGLSIRALAGIGTAHGILPEGSSIGLLAETGKLLAVLSTRTEETALGLAACVSSMWECSPVGTGQSLLALAAAADSGAVKRLFAENRVWPSAVVCESAEKPVHPEEARVQLAVTAENMAWHYRHLGEMDADTLALWDDRTLEEMDFVIL